MNLGWLHFALACVLGAGAVLAAVAGLSFPPLLPVAVALGYGSYRLGAHAIDRVAGGVYQQVGVEPNEDGTVGAPGEESGWRYVGRVDYEPHEEPEFAWDDDFWHEAETDGGERSEGPQTPSDSRCSSDGSEASTASRASSGERSEPHGGVGATDGSGDAGSRGIVADRRTREACEVLGVEPGATREEVRAAYRARVKEVHPDHGGDREAFAEVQRAYDHLRSRRRSA